MDRIIKVGQYFYDVTYRLDQETPVLESVHALNELILFDRAMPILFESSDRITLVDTQKLCVDMGGTLKLETVLLEALKNPKTEPAMQAVR